MAYLINNKTVSFDNKKYGFVNYWTHFLLSYIGVTSECDGVLM